jgi:hypothetical protein
MESRIQGPISVPKLNFIMYAHVLENDEENLELEQVKKAQNIANRSILCNIKIT